MNNTSDPSNPADQLTSFQLFHVQEGIKGIILNWIAHTIPTSKRFEPIRHQAELEGRQRCLEWAQDIVEAAQVLGIADNDMETWLLQAGMVISAARFDRLPNDPPADS